MTTILFLYRLLACLLRSKRLLQRCGVHRQLAHAFAGRRKDRVGEAMTEVPGSPIPPGGSELRAMWTSMTGVSLMRKS
jgi:hypothetical protein